jgi:hypothetical protein
MKYSIESTPNVKKRSPYPTNKKNAPVRTIEIVRKIQIITENNNNYNCINNVSY